jgi:hypothetical protein
MLLAQFESKDVVECALRTSLRISEVHSKYERFGYMKDSREAAVISEALGVIDKALGEMLQRELVSTGEVADLLLDVRLLLTASSTVASSSTTEV